MQPFELPDFSIPSPARVNPRLESTRSHSRAWAREMGFLARADGADGPGAGLWDERAYDAADYALLSAYAHPDAPRPLLDLVNDWYVWVFYFGDHFLETFKRGRDIAGARAHLDRLAAFLPDDPVLMPPPVNAVERGLADLWARTAPAMPADWRRRFAHRTCSLFQAAMWELSNINDLRVPNPIEYVETRRTAGGAPWSAVLVELVIGGEVPRRIAATRTLRALSDAHADAVHLRNDLSSYHRETEEEGELSNGVLVVERFFDHDPRQAAAAVDELLASRLRQFETTARTELSPLIEEYELDPAERSRVLDYVTGLRDWQAGAHEWHLRSGRYPNAAERRLSQPGPPGGPTGIGTAAARVTRARRASRPAAGEAAGPTARTGGRSADRARETGDAFELPPLFMPFPARLSPYVDDVRRQVRDWAGEMGMLDPAGVSGRGVWRETGFEDADYGLFAALTHPAAAPAELELVADWHVWGFFAGDFFAERFGRPRDLAGAKACIARLPEFMPLNPERTPPPVSPVERGLADLWARTAPAMPARARARFAGQVQDLVGSRYWELANLARHRMPDPVDYVRMRRRTSGAGFSTTLAAYALTPGLPAEVGGSRAWRRLTEAFADVAPLRDDLVSYHRETGRESHSGVGVVREFFGCNTQHAANVLADLAESRLREFGDIADREVPALGDELGLDPAARTALRRHVSALKDWLAGELRWSLRTGRYAPPGTGRGSAREAGRAGPGAAGARPVPLRAGGSGDDRPAAHAGALGG